MAPELKSTGANRSVHCRLLGWWQHEDEAINFTLHVPQVHLLKLFDNVKSLSFGRSSKQVLGMGSSEGETFLLRELVPVEGPVEVWMTAVETEMCNSLRSITKEGVYRYAHEERQGWITSVLSMVSLVGSQIWWTWEVRNSRVSRYFRHRNYIRLDEC